MSRTNPSPQGTPAQPAPASPTTPSKRQLWFAAVKPPMYTVAITPITVGSAAAFADTGALHLPTLALFLAAAVLIIAWLNLCNDVFDYDTGIDVNKPESVVNLLGGTRRSRDFLLVFAHIMLAFAFSFLARISSFPFDPTVLLVIALAVFGGYAYQGPPFRLGYYGLGEPICFVTWALGVAAAHYSQIRHYGPIAVRLRSMTLLQRLSFLTARAFERDSSLSAAILLVAAPTTIILFCSHFHQLRDDQNAGKKSPIVRLGTALAARVLRAALIACFCLEVILFASGTLPVFPFMLTMLSAPYAIQLESFVARTHAVPDVVRVAKYYAVKFHFVHGMLLTLGFFLTNRTRVASW